MSDIRSLEDARATLLSAFVTLRELNTRKPWLFDEDELCRLALMVCNSFSPSALKLDYGSTQEDIEHNFEMLKLIEVIEKRMLKNKVRRIIEELGEDEKMLDEVVNRLGGEDEEESEEEELTEPLFDHSDRD